MQNKSSVSQSTYVPVISDPTVGHDPTSQVVLFSIFIVVGVAGNSAVLYIFMSFVQYGRVRLIALALASVDLVQCAIIIPAHMALQALNPTFDMPSNGLCKTIAASQRLVAI